MSSPPRPPGAAFLFALLVAGLGACANPVPPTGGPPDRTPPVFAETNPPAFAVNVEGRTVEITFSEYVDQASFTRALSVTPPVDGRLAFDWKGRRVTIRFPQDLRPNTTYVLTLDTNLRDVRNVPLDRPLTLAFSTGPEINRGRIAGRVVGAARGEGAGGFDVYAYALPDSAPPAVLPELPDYRTQTDQEGAFVLDFLNEQPYYVVALEDRNRNRLPDALEPFAAPPRPVIRADSGAAGVDVPWIAAVLDTIPPELRQVRALSDRRLALRFSEPVHLAELDTLADTLAARTWTVVDSATGRPAAVEAAYTLPDDPRQVFVATGPLPPVPHLLRPGPVADTSGNLVPPFTHAFTPAEAADTLSLRFLGFVPDDRPAGEDGTYALLPEESAGVRFNQPVGPERLREIVEVSDTTGAARGVEARTDDGVTYRLTAAPAFAPGVPFQVAVDAPGADTTLVRAFRRIPADELGEVTGVVAAPDASAVVVELHPVDLAFDLLPRRVRPGADGTFAFAGLPAGSYRLRAFVDRDGDGGWDPGRLLPYAPAEPVVWSGAPLQVRARWTIALEDTVRISDFGF